MRREPLANRDIRISCMENGVKFWQVALQLGISAETFTRRMRTELDEDEKKAVMHSVMLNPEIDPITTPYMRFYELEALCMMGLHTEVMHEMKAYWGGMLREGATSFWEKYVPHESGTQHLTMYGRPYGKSLCHAWGASPIYLLGRYALGVSPTSAGYKTYNCDI